MAGPRHADDRWFWPAILFATALALTGAWFFYRSMTESRSFRALSDTAREELADVTMPTQATAAVERDWVTDFGTPEFLLAPAGPLPCPGAETTVPAHQQPAAQQAIALRGSNDPDALAPLADADPDNLLVALVFGTELIQAGRHSEAARVIGQVLDRTRVDNDIIERARVPGSPLELDDANVSTVIHLYHAAGVAQLQQPGGGTPWVSLKNVIGCVKALSDRRLVGTSRGEPTWSRLAIPAPGCTKDANNLSSWDLYNNLIVAYMKGGYTGTQRDREREFARSSLTTGSPISQLLDAHVKRAREDGWKNESQLWALSNVERVLGWRKPDDARLNLNAIAVIDYWLDEDRCPKTICTDALKSELAARKEELLEQAVLRHNVTQEQQRSFATTATRLLAASNVDRAKVAGAVETIRTWLPPAHAATVAELLAADEARRKLPRWIVGLSKDEQPPEAKLARRGEEWRRAAEIDFAEAAAVWAKRRSAEEQTAVLIAARQLLGAREMPPTLKELDAKRSFGQRLGMRFKASRVWWRLVSVLLALAIWFVLMMIVMAVRDWRLLRTSFYNVELEHLRASEPPPRRRSAR